MNTWLLSRWRITKDVSILSVTVSSSPRTGRSRWKRRVAAVGLQAALSHLSLVIVGVVYNKGHVHGQGARGASGQEKGVIGVVNKGRGC